MRLATLLAPCLILASTTASAQLAGSVATPRCTSLVMDLAAEGAELYALKTHNSGGGPDFHRDWLFDLTATGGSRTTGTTATGMQWSVDDLFDRATVPPEEAFVVLTFPGGRLAIDSTSMRGGTEDIGAVQIQTVGDSLPVGVENGIGLELPGEASTYTAAVGDRTTGGLASFPYGTRGGIVVAFAPVVEVNANDPAGMGCTVGGSALDEESRFGLIAGYNIYRIPGVPSVVPAPEDFVGHWQYYAPYSGFDLAISEAAGQAGPDVNGDTLPDGDGQDALNDAYPDDLVGLLNPDGLTYSGDEVLLFQDSPTNPDGSPRLSGTAPDLSGGQGYWYAVQPVLFQGSTQLGDYDGRTFGLNAEFGGTHALDTDADGIAESLDLDLDGRRDFYSPQVVTGQTGLGLAHAGTPLLSAPVFGRANPLPASASPRLAGVATDGGRAVRLSLVAGLESGEIAGLDVRRLASPGVPAARVNDQPILLHGEEGRSYELVDRLPAASRRASRADLGYEVDVLLTSGETRTFGPFRVPLSRRR